MTEEVDWYAVDKHGRDLELTERLPIAHGLTARVYRLKPRPLRRPAAPDSDPPPWLSYEEPAS